MKKMLKTGIAALLFSFAFVALSGLGTVKASADTLKADLDGDGKEEAIEWTVSENEDGKKILDTFTIGGKDVYEATKEAEPLQDYEISIYTLDTSTKDKYTEVVVQTSVDSWLKYTVYRYNNGKITKYAYIDGADELVSQKSKNRIKTRTYVFVHGIGNIRVDEEYKIKSGKATLVTKTYKPNKLNETVSFKSTVKMTVYKDADMTTEAGTLKSGEKFKLIKFQTNGSDEFALVYIKTKSGVTGWIDTADYDGSKFIVKNPPLWN